MPPPLRPNLCRTSSAQQGELGAPLTTITRSASPAPYDLALPPPNNKPPPSTQRIDQLTSTSSPSRHQGTGESQIPSSEGEKGPPGDRLEGPAAFLLSHSAQEALSSLLRVGCLFAQESRSLESLPLRLTSFARRLKGSAPPTRKPMSITTSW